MSPLAKRQSPEPSTTRDDWTTPLEIKERLLEFTDGKRIALDPCSNPNSIIDAKVEWYGPHVGGRDGLVTPWVGEGLVFVNNPYSQNFIWARKCHDEGNRRLRDIIALMPGDTSTEWFQRYAASAAMRCFWAKRLTFGGDRQYPARFPSILIYWGLKLGKFKKVFGKRGFCA